MYREIGGIHNIPHFHAKYQEVLKVRFLREVYPIKSRTGSCMAEIHNEDLIVNWKLLSEGREFFRIDPLR